MLNCEPAYTDQAAQRHVEGRPTPWEEMELAAVVGANDNLPVAPQPVGLAELRNLPGYIYLGSPYSKYRLGHECAAYEVGVAAARLMARGFPIYCPIVHGHFTSKYGELPQTWEFWKEQCQPMIDGAAALIVLQMDGWLESVGLTYEIAEFQRAGKPIVYMTQKRVMEVAA